MKLLKTPIKTIENAQIVLSDGLTLSALIWLPEDAADNPVPAILEYLPYRKRDKTSLRDHKNHPYVAGHGYACVRVDIRGTGDSQGELLGEYLQQEQDDALEVLRWIAAQPWCTGSIGMIGISWGGFNGLQVAALRPPELKAVITLCSTDDRYADDIHYKGGCQLVENFFWGVSMFAINGTPPDPVLVGDKWRSMWLERLEAGGFYIEDWHRHQRRDDFWKHASICEDYSSLQCPVYVVGGWADPYTNTVFRMLENLECPRKGLIGPWGHLYPNFAEPHPQIDFLQECLQWWDKWLKGVETGIMDEPMLKAYIQDTVQPQTHFESQPGNWVAENSWPSNTTKPWRWNLADGRLLDSGASAKETLSICSPQTTGFAGGKWLIFGSGVEWPSDQRQEVGGSLIFDTPPLEEALSILGAPVVRLKIASDKPDAFVAATLSEVLPDGSVTRFSYSFLNLTHRDSHEELKALIPGEFYNVSFKLNDCGQRISAGNRIRLALSSAYFPMVWPTPETTTLTVDCAHSGLDLPIRRASPLDDHIKPWKPAINGPPPDEKVLRKPSTRTSVNEDLATGEKVYRCEKDEGLVENRENKWRYGGTEIVESGILPNDPTSAWSKQSFTKEYGRGSLDVGTSGWAKMTVSKGEYHITAHIDAWENRESIFSRDYSANIPRDYI